MIQDMRRNYFETSQSQEGGSGQSSTEIKKGNP